MWIQPHRNNGGITCVTFSKAHSFIPSRALLLCFLFVPPYPFCLSLPLALFIIPFFRSPSLCLLFSRSFSSCRIYIPQQAKKTVLQMKAQNSDSNARAFHTFIGYIECNVCVFDRFLLFSLSLSRLGFARIRCVLLFVCHPRNLQTERIVQTKKKIHHVYLRI